MTQIVRVFPAVSNPSTREWYHEIDVVEAIPFGIIGAEKCVLCLKGCPKPIPAFAYLSNESDAFRNDFSSFILDVPVNATVTCTLIEIAPDGTETNHVIVDNTYGTFLSTGLIRLNTWAFILRWFRVADVLGFGTYKVNIQIENSASTVIFDQTTPCYVLKPWTCENAHGTVRITTEQSGYIVNGFDYRGLEYLDVTNVPGSPFLAATFKTTWPQQLRWYGVMRETTPTLITDKISDSNYNEQQVQDQIVRNFFFRLNHIRTDLSFHFIMDNLLATEIVVQDYNINNNLPEQENFDGIRMNPIEIADRLTTPLNENEFFTVNLEEYNQGRIKRH